MKLDLKYFWLAYKEAMESDEIECLEDASKYIEWIAAQSIHKEFIEFVSEYPFYETIQACAHNLYGPVEIYETNIEYSELAGKYIILGSAPNGDFIASPLPKMECIGFICHDHIDMPEFPKFVEVSNSFGKFFYNSWHIEDSPCDYWDVVNSKK